MATRRGQERREREDMVGSMQLTQVILESGAVFWKGLVWSPRWDLDRLFCFPRTQEIKLASGCCVDLRCSSRLSP